MSLPAEVPDLEDEDEEELEVRLLFPPMSENPEDFFAVVMEKAVLTTLSPSFTPVRISVFSPLTRPVVTSIGAGRPFFQTRTIFFQSDSEIAAVGTITAFVLSSVMIVTVAVMLL